MSEQPEQWAFEPVPKGAQRLYRMTWQLETWLRTIVYVELRAARVDWEEPIKQKVSKWPPASLTSDKSLHHMATPHQAALSFLTFGQLWSVISDAGNWPLFEPYFPPKSNVEGNRPAHPSLARGLGCKGFLDPSQWRMGDGAGGEGGVGIGVGAAD